MTATTAAGLFVRTFVLVKYQCKGAPQQVRLLNAGRATELELIAPCAWSGLFPLEDELTAAEVRSWFSCPTHGDEATDIQTVQLKLYREERQRRPRGKS